MDAKERAIARNRTAMTLFAAYISFLLGGYATRFDWVDWRWVPTVLESGVLAALLFILIRGFWRPGADLRFW